jgi:hypothetical protein
VDRTIEGRGRLRTAEAAAALVRIVLRRAAAATASTRGDMITTVGFAAERVRRAISGKAVNVDSAEAEVGTAAAGAAAVSDAAGSGEVIGGGEPPTCDGKVGRLSDVGPPTAVGASLFSAAGAFDSSAVVTSR